MLADQTHPVNSSRFSRAVSTPSAIRSRSNESTASSGSSSTVASNCSGVGGSIRVGAAVPDAIDNRWCCRCRRRHSGQLAGEPGTQLSEAGTLEQHGDWQRHLQIDLDQVLQFNRHQGVDSQFGQRLMHVHFGNRTSEHSGNLLGEKLLNQSMTLRWIDLEELFPREPVFRSLRLGRTGALRLRGQHGEKRWRVQSPGVWTNRVRWP